MFVPTEWDIIVETKQRELRTEKLESEVGAFGRLLLAVWRAETGVLSCLSEVVIVGELGAGFEGWAWAGDYP